MLQIAEGLNRGPQEGHDLISRPQSGQGRRPFRLGHHQAFRLVEVDAERADIG